MMQDPMMQDPMAQEPMGAPDPMAGADPMAGQPDPAEGDRELMEAMERAINMGREIVYEPSIFEGIIESIKGNPVDSLASTVVAVLDKIREYAGDIPPNIALGVGMALIADIADALQQTGHHTYQPQEIEAAVAAATNMYLVKHDGEFTLEELEGYADELGAATLAPGGPMQGAPQAPMTEPMPPEGGGFLGGA